MNFAPLITSASISARWTEAASNRIPFLGEGLFPADKKAGLDLKWLKGANGLPVSLMPSAFDVKSTFRNRPGFEFTETEMPFFKEGYHISEKDRQDLLRAADSRDPYAREIIAKIYNDSDNLIKGALVVGERERMQLLFAEDGNAGITFVANGVAYVYNYDPNGAWKAGNYFELTGESKWSDAEHADPYADIDAAKQAINEKTGENIELAIMNSVTFNKLMKMKSIKDRFLSSAGVSVGYLTKAEVRRVVEDTAEVRIIVYDKQYADENGIAHKFVPDGYVSLVPSGALGKTWFGTTPKEADLIAGGQVDVSIINKGIAVKKIVESDPVNVSIIASEIVLPSFERMDACALLKVL